MSLTHIAQAGVVILVLSLAMVAGFVQAGRVEVLG